ncbi:ATP synthase subunit C [[Clostridium] polysaccharolyticum]|uniref:V/A-type H+-transporting ATPase subunit K n=1 Tax=[Clostridium] polysaccharolyticum TaxID=29364 RepID=A0A1I0D854_9FIRM|nr:ATP synthase subunit C [[Clostridium] polysaccharolyticum]SET27829.1 V/A-type H+-transporting ATPase subunit K [[Clostridium] polysaccharolyticum]
MFTKILLCVILIASILVPGGYYLFSEKKKGNFKAALGFNILFFFGTLIIGDILLFSGNIQAAETAKAASSTEGWRYLAAALSTGLSCVGAGIAVASAASSALGALSEDSSIMGKALIFVALAESIALYGLIISFTILG